MLPAAFPATRYVDEDVEDPKAYAYRVRYSKGALRSADVEARSEPIDLMLPRDLAVTRTETGFHLVQAGEGAVTVPAGGEKEARERSITFSYGPSSELTTASPEPGSTVAESGSPPTGEEGLEADGLA